QRAGEIAHRSLPKRPVFVFCSTPYALAMPPLIALPEAEAQAFDSKSGSLRVTELQKESPGSSSAERWNGYAFMRRSRVFLTMSAGGRVSRAPRELLAACNCT